MSYNKNVATTGQRKFGLNLYYSFNQEKNVYKSINVDRVPNEVANFFWSTVEGTKGVKDAKRVTSKLSVKDLSYIHSSLGELIKDAIAAQMAAGMNVQEQQQPSYDSGE